MKLSPIVLQGFEGREEGLRSRLRYQTDFTDVMYYRTNDLIHARRVLSHLETALYDIQLVYGTSFDTNFARTFALVHDDAEIITKDISLHDKEQMTPAEKEEHKRKELAAIETLAQRYPEKANGYDYRDLLLAALHKDRLEAQLVSLFDKHDGFGEACHEVWAGNSRFVRAAGGIKDGKTGSYVRRINEFPTKYPAMKPFFQQFPHYLQQ